MNKRWLEILLPILLIIVILLILLLFLQQRRMETVLLKQTRPSVINMSTNPMKEEIIASKYQEYLRSTFAMFEKIKLFDMSVPKRIKLYKYLDNENVNISAYFPGVKVEDWQNAKRLWAIVKSLPKGSAHHEHNFSIIYTMNFLIHLLNNLPKEYSIIFIDNLEPIKDHPHLKLAENKSLRLVKKSFINSLPVDIFNKSFFLVILSESSTTISPISLEKISDYTLKLITKTRDISQSAEGRNTINIKSLESVLFITPETVGLFRDKEWSYLRFFTQRAWQINTNVEILPIYWHYLAKKAKEENLQDVQIKYDLFSWHYNEDNLYFPNDEKYTLTLASNIIKEIKETTDISIHVVYALPRNRKKELDTKTLSSSDKLIAKFRSIRDSDTHKIVVGYDIVGEEDMGDENRKYYDNLIEFQKERPLETAFMLHSGETNRVKYPVDQNLLLASSLPGSLRVGHGLALWKYPKLYPKYIGRVLIELCPISNSFLRYVKDSRNHPGIAYINENIDVSISTDNRGLLNYEYVTYDWFELITALQLPFKTIVNIGKNSTQYASKTHIINNEIQNRWVSAYEKFIDNY